MKLILLIASIILFGIAAIIGFGVTNGDYNGWLALGLVAFAASFLPLDGAWRVPA